MAGRRWQDLTPRARRVIIGVGLVDAALRLAALRDLRRRPTVQVRGSKRVWAAAVALVSSGGVLPTCYFLLGRRGGR